jgi:hypothetical protein
MSEYTKPCTTCKQQIRMSNNSGKWLPSNLDGSRHFCSSQQAGTTKDTKDLTVEERLKRLEQIVLDPRK